MCKARAGPGRARRQGAMAEIRGLNILVVEDHEDSLDLLTELLRHYGAEVVAAPSAARAMAILERWRPDVLVSNIGMPDMDGCALLQHLRMLSPERGGAIPAI